MLAPENRKYWKSVILNSAIGIVFMFVNFPKFLQRVTLQLVGDKGLGAVLLGPATWTQRVMAAVIELISSSPQDAFQVLISCSFIGLFFYLFALVVFSVRQSAPIFLGLGVGGLVLGALTFHLISWMVLITFLVLKLLSAIIGFIAKFIGIVFAFLVRHAWWIFLLAFVIYMLYLFREYLLKIVVVAVIITGVAIILKPLLPGLWRWLVSVVTFISRLIAMTWDRYITPIFDFLMVVIRGILFVVTLIFYTGVAILFLIGILTTLGHLVVDQIKAAWHAGNGRRGVLLAAFGIGTSFALVFLTCVANPELVNSIQGGWKWAWQRLDGIVGTSLATSSIAHARLTYPFVLTMPQIVRTFVFQNLTTVSAPMFDVSLLLVILIISYVGILRRAIHRLPDHTDPVPVTFYPREYFKIFGGLIVAVAVIFLQAWSERDS